MGVTAQTMLLALAAVLVAAAPALASDSTPTFAVQWTHAFTGKSWIEPATGQFRNGNTVGIAAKYFEMSDAGGSSTESSGVCQFYNILEPTPTWCTVLSTSVNNVPMILGGGDNSVFAALVNASDHGHFELYRYISGPTSEPDYTVSGNATAAVLGLSGNGDVAAVIEPLDDGTQAVALYATTATPFATGNVAMSGEALFGAVSFGSPSPSMFFSNGLDYAVVSTFTAETMGSGQTPGAFLDVCNGGEVVLTISSSGVTIAGYALKTNTFTVLTTVSSAYTGHLSIGCTTATALSEGSIAVFAVSRTAATLQASMVAPDDTTDVVPSDTGAVVVIVTDSALLAWVSPYSAAPIELAVPSADANKMAVFEPPIVNGVLAYVMFNQFTNEGVSLVLALVNGTIAGR